jgi:hypothetical protein
MERYPRAVLYVGAKGVHVDMTDIKYTLKFSDKTFHPFLNSFMISILSYPVPHYSITN